MDVTDEQARAELNTIKARGRLKDAKKIFAHRGQQQGLPRSERSQRILEWGSDMAWLAADVSKLGPRQALQKRERSVRNWCRSKRPQLTKAELAALVERTRTSNKRWSNDESAAVIDIGVHNRPIGYKFIGASDDPFYVHRHAEKRKKGAARARKFRAANGAKPHANSLSRTKPWEKDGISRASYYRHRKAGGGTHDETNSSRDIS
jgi:hypothetical protein